MRDVWLKYVTLLVVDIAGRCQKGEREVEVVGNVVMVTVQLALFLADQCAVSCKGKRLQIISLSVTLASD